MIVEHYLHFNNMEQIIELIPRLTAFASRYYADPSDREDLVQETIYRALKGNYQKREGVSLFSFLTTVMRNEYINRYRHHRTGRQIFVDNAPEASLVESSQDVFHNFELQDLHKAMEALSPDYRAVQELSLKGYKYHEIAKVMKLPLGTVKGTLYRCRQQLKSIITS